jgi:hypothetical protein
MSLGKSHRVEQSAACLALLGLKIGIEFREVPLLIWMIVFPQW